MGVINRQEEALECCQRDSVCYYCCVLVCHIDEQGARVYNKYILTVLNRHCYDLRCNRFIRGRARD